LKGWWGFVGVARLGFCGGAEGCGQVGTGGDTSKALSLGIFTGAA
jgi:hypothetical protein